MLSYTFVINYSEREGIELILNYIFLILKSFPN